MKDWCNFTPSDNNWIGNSKVQNMTSDLALSVFFGGVGFVDLKDWCNFTPSDNDWIGNSKVQDMTSIFSISVFIGGLALRICWFEGLV